MTGCTMHPLHYKTINLPKYSKETSIKVYQNVFLHLSGDQKSWEYNAISSELFVYYYLKFCSYSLLLFCRSFMSRRRCNSFRSNFVLRQQSGSWQMLKVWEEANVSEPECVGAVSECPASEDQWNTGISPPIPAHHLSISSYFICPMFQ